MRPKPKKEKYLKFGEWNHLKIKVKEGEIITWLNGRKMISFSDEKIKQANGKIALQIHDGGGIKVLWRNINLKHL